jgi:hypothetical protein
MERLRCGQPPSVECVRRPLPASLADLLRTCLAISPGERPTAQAMLQTLSTARCSLLRQPVRHFASCAHRVLMLDVYALHEVHVFRTPG